jgi:glucuronokinase
VIVADAPARVGLLGNPSDGYGGRTLGFAVPAFGARVTLAPGDGIAVSPGPDDLPIWASSRDLVDRIDRFGFGTGTQVLAATIRTFIDVCDSVDHRRPDDFELSYRTTIPRQVGLAGSSALVVAGLRCLCEYVELEIPDPVLASLALRVETDQLGITAGLQDRVVQTLGGLVAMDFSHLEIDARFGVAHGHYESLDPELLPPLFVAYRSAAAGPSGTYHAGLRSRFDAGDPVVRSTMRELAALVTEGRAALRWHDHRRFAELVAQNMELRRRLGPLPLDQVALVDLAGSCDAPATFAGSGGAIVGVADDAEHLVRLERVFINRAMGFIAL